MGVANLASNVITDFRNSSLSAHNAKRALHTATPTLALDNGLCDQAQAYAENLAGKIGGMNDVAAHFIHDAELGACGENLSFAANFFPTIEAGVSACAGDSVTSWYDEIANFVWSNPDGHHNGTVGHFTQVAWKGTTKLGIGIGVRDNFKYQAGSTVYTLQAYFVVGRYIAPGNITGQYTTNVMPLF